MARVEIYTIPGCGYCIRAKRLLDQKNVEYVEHDVTRDTGALDRMHTTVTGRTFPQILIDGREVGGCDDLQDLDYAGKLDRMLEAPSEPGQKDSE